MFFRVPVVMVFDRLPSACPHSFSLEGVRQEIFDRAGNPEALSRLRLESIVISFRELEGNVLHTARHPAGPAVNLAGKAYSAAEYVIKLQKQPLPILDRQLLHPLPTQKLGG